MATIQKDHNVGYIQAKLVEDNWVRTTRQHKSTHLDGGCTKDVNTNSDNS